jgi:hypothetical protein
VDLVVLLEDLVEIEDAELVETTVEICAPLRLVALLGGNPNSTTSPVI